jgi:hypothetical protein
VLHLRLIILSVRDDVPVDSESLFVTDFMNLKIKSTYPFRDAHRDRIYVCAFIGVSTHTYINIYIYTVFLNFFFGNFNPTGRTGPTENYY